MRPGRGGEDRDVESGEAAAGIIVDEVDEVITLTAEQVEDIPRSPGAGAVAKVDERLLLLLDARRVLGDSRVADA